MNSTDRTLEIRKFHVVVVQRRLRDVQKSVMHVQRSILLLETSAVLVPCYC